MGNNKTKITYETVDKTDPQAREQGRQAAMRENQQKLRELEQRLHQQQQAVQREGENLRLQNEQSMENLEQKIRAERERQTRETAARKKAEQEAMEQKAFLKMKTSLLNYEFGSRIGVPSFKELDISDVNNVRIVLIGPTGSGKTSFIGTLERTLLGRERQTAFEQGAGAEGTVNLEEYLSLLKFNLVDTRGFFEVNEQTVDECLKIMEGRIFVGDTIKRAHDGGQAEDDVGRPAAKFSDQAHAVIFVVMANDPRLRGGEYLERMKKIRNHFRSQGHSPVTVITCLDKLKTEDDKDKAFYEASAATGSPRDRTFFITNYTYENHSDSFPIEQQAVNIVDSVLYSAERYIKIQKLRLKHHGKTPGGGGGIGEETVQQLFSKLQARYQWDEAKVSRVVRAFQEHEIKTAVALKECWEGLKDSVGMSLGMKRLVGEELKNI